MVFDKYDVINYDSLIHSETKQSITKNLPSYNLLLNNNQM